MIRKDDLNPGCYIYLKFAPSRFPVAHEILMKEETTVRLKDCPAFSDSSWADVEYYDIEPIPISKQWIEALGFEYDFYDKYYKKDKFKVISGPGGWSLLSRDGQVVYGSSMEFVHHLQNLYRQLSQEQLKVTGKLPEGPSDVYENVRLEFAFKGGRINGLLNGTYKYWMFTSESPAFLQLVPNGQLMKFRLFADPIPEEWKEFYTALWQAAEAKYYDMTEK